MAKLKDSDYDYDSDLDSVKIYAKKTWFWRNFNKNVIDYSWWLLMIDNYYWWLFVIIDDYWLL